MRSFLDRLQTLIENFKRLKLQATIIQTDACDTNHWWDGTLFECAINAKIYPPIPRCD